MGPIHNCKVLATAYYFIAESQFAAVYVTSEEYFVLVARSFVDVALSFGLAVKTKGMKMEDESSFVNGVPVCNQSVGMMKEFHYLGNTIFNDDWVDIDVKIRIAKVTSAFSCLKKSQYMLTCLYIAVKHAVYHSYQSFSYTYVH